MRGLAETLSVSCIGSVVFTIKAPSTLNCNKRLEYFGGGAMPEPFPRPVADQLDVMF